jgi:hypothetical protein
MGMQFLIQVEHIFVMLFTFMVNKYLDHFNHSAVGTPGEDNYLVQFLRRNLAEKGDHFLPCPLTFPADMIQIKPLAFFHSPRVVIINAPDRGYR